jgi:hypothetical protein
MPAGEHSGVQGGASGATTTAAAAARSRAAAARTATSQGALVNLQHIRQRWVGRRDVEQLHSMPSFLIYLQWGAERVLKAVRSITEHFPADIWLSSCVPAMLQVQQHQAV